MKIDFSQTIKTQEGDIIYLDDKKKEPVTLKGVLERSLNFGEAPAAITAEQKYKRYLIFKRLSQEGVDFSAEEVSMMKQAVGEFPWLPWILGSVWDMLDQKSVQVPTLLRTSTAAKSSSRSGSK